MPRRRRKTTLSRWLERWVYWYRLWTDPAFARRSEGGRKAAATQKTRRSMAVKQSHHPECQWSFSIVSQDGDFQRATWLCVTECLAIGSEPNAPEPAPRRWRQASELGQGTP